MLAEEASIDYHASTCWIYYDLKETNDFSEFSKARLFWCKVFFVGILVIVIIK